ncbi:helix-turn-helix transcriptional regulator [Desulfoluna spongiiphila]|uniref:histidine kinase n=1 Tax=Desulfoluna spongiiphila TaxID=419481 RepID=A0A1G5ARE5_9BACT|nr:PAS domain S-box protein [Desulfoluna spongiiphila]SCX80390.1 PAS domain S-box-containing protein [Desulfoluna spongiiphila]VVS91957.1 pas fold-3 [Desulfoluna spongiiphila]
MQDKDAKIQELTRRIHELELNDRFMGLLEKALDAVYIIDFSGNFIDANDTALLMLGYERHELADLNFFELIRKDQKTHATGILGNPEKRTGFTEALEFRVRRKDGSHIWISTRARLIKENDVPVSLHGIAVDITDRKKREEDLKNREENLIMALEGAELGVWYWRVDKKVVTLERGWGKRFGVENGESMPQAEFLNRLHPSERPFVSGSFTLHLKGETDAVHVRHRLKGRDGAWLWMSTRGKAVEKRPDGHVLTVAGTFLDVTRQVRMERALKRRKAEVEEKVSRLEESQAALRALLTQREKDREELGENMTATLRHLVLPSLEKVTDHPLTPTQKKHLDAAMTSLSEIISPFTRRLASPFINLTPMELKVAEFIRQGHTSKEMAAMLHLSKGTIDFHRNNIRKKLGLNNSGANLRTQLLSLTR